ncbi:MAG TPA: glycosyltransferase family 4 protein [Ktedonobacteraceae bacterium]|nr:glycosyltransferase family 4 protein [Ktedonobacteraceae bacterium]
MKILIVTHYFAPHTGGIEIVAYHQAKELVKQGHEVTIVTSKLKREKAVEQIEGNRIVRVPAWNLLEEKFNVPYPIFSLRLVSTMIREIKRADIIHAHGILYLGSFISSFFARIYKKPFIVTEHIGFVTYKSSITTAIEKLALYTIGLITLRASDITIVLNTSVQRWIKQYKNEVYYLPNGVDLELFDKPPEQETSNYNLLFLGRLEKIKGVESLIQAIPFIIKVFPQTTLTIVGDGGNKTDLFNLTKNLQLEKHIQFTGWVEHKDLDTYYEKASLVVVPSIVADAFPLVILEAMSAGRPVIGTNIGGIPEIIDDKVDGYLVEPENPEQIADKVIKLFQEANLLKELGRNARKKAEKFSIEKHVENLEKIYEGVIKKYKLQSPLIVEACLQRDNDTRSCTFDERQMKS